MTGFVSLTNTSPHAKPVRVETSDNRSTVLAAHDVVVSPHGTKIVNLEELLSAPGSEGGIRITYDGASTDVLINGGLEDQAVGYSAILPFTHDLQNAGQTSQATVAELGLMVGAADPMMSFPAATRFTPYSVLRNLSNTPAALTPTLWWMEAGAAHSAQLGKLVLPSFSAKSLDVMAMITAAGLKNFNGSINLVFDVEGTAGGLLMVAGSVDQTNTYVFEVIPRAIRESVSKSLSYWSTANGDDTMVSVWNPTDEPQDFVFTLSFSGGHYGYPIHLEPRASRSFNVSEIIHNQIPDAEGNIIPASVHDGGAKIAGSQGDNEHILVAMDAGTYNVRKATCGLYCQTCNGATAYSVLDNPFTVPVAAQKQQSFHVQYNTGQQYTSGANWTSSNTSLATVGATTGLVQGLSPGSPSISAVDGYADPNYVSYWCEGSWWSCPLTMGGSAGSGGTVTPTVSISGPTKVPLLNSGTQGPNSIQLTASPTPSGGSYSWTVTSGASFVTVLNATSQTAIIQSKAAGTSSVQVQYTYNGQSATATQTVKVQLPARLGVVSDTGSIQDFSCGGVPYLCGVRRDILYQVEEADGTPIPAAMPISETFTSVSNTCKDLPNTPTPSSGTTLTTGAFPSVDRLAMRSLYCLPADANGKPQGSCDVVVDQRWLANGYSAAYQQIDYSCRSVTLAPLQ